MSMRESSPFRRVKPVYVRGCAGYVVLVFESPPGYSGKYMRLSLHRTNESYSFSCGFGSIDEAASSGI